MLVYWASFIPCWALASSHLCAGQPQRSPLPKKALAVPYSLEAGMLVLHIVVAMLSSMDVEWKPISSGYHEAIFSVFREYLTANIT